jgi:hypothetical protein
MKARLNTEKAVAFYGPDFKDEPERPPCACGHSMWHHDSFSGRCHHCDCYEPTPRTEDRP